MNYRWKLYTVEREWNLISRGSPSSNNTSEVTCQFHIVTVLESKQSQLYLRGSQRSFAGAAERWLRSSLLIIGKEWKAVVCISENLRYFQKLPLPLISKELLIDCGRVREPKHLRLKPIGNCTSEIESNWCSRIFRLPWFILTVTLWQKWWLLYLSP